VEKNFEFELEPAHVEKNFRQFQVGYGSGLWEAFG
jgi:hypothetical protein